MATVQRIRGSIRPSARAFVEDAERQLERSRMANSYEESVVYSYRAALRAAGALIEWAMRKRKRRPSGSAWAKLRALDPSLGDWANRFETHARLASRAEMGLERGLHPMVAERLYEQACELVDLARERTEYLPKIA